MRDKLLLHAVHKCDNPTDLLYSIHKAIIKRLDVQSTMSTPERDIEIHIVLTPIESDSKANKP